MNLVDVFKGEYRFLSNFWLCKISYEGISYPSVEHAYVAAKTLDERERVKISKLKYPSDAKKAGYKLKLRSDWETVKVGIMEDLLIEKFSHPSLKKMLLSTGDAILEEGNTHNDTFWGICNGVGENMLGMLLMKVRDRYS